LRIKKIIKMKDIFNEMGEFSIKRFPEAEAKHHLIKLKHEADEAIDNLTDIEEFADCLLALYAAIYKSGFIYEDIVMSAKDKLEALKKRNWTVKDGIYQHVTHSINSICHKFLVFLLMFI